MSFLKPYEGKIIVITSKNCPHCQVYKESIESDPTLKEKTVFLPIEESRVAQLLSQVLDIRAVPTIVGLEVQDGKVNLCKIGKGNKVESCIQGDASNLDKYYEDKKEKREN